MGATGLLLCFVWPLMNSLCVDAVHCSTDQATMPPIHAPPLLADCTTVGARKR